MGCGDQVSLNPNQEPSLIWDSGNFTFPEIEIFSPPSKDPIPVDRLLALIDATLKDRGDFTWEMVDSYTLWSAVVGGDSIVYVGYKVIGLDSLDYSTLDLQDPIWQEARAYTIEYVLQELKALHPDQAFTEEQILVKEQKLIPLIQLRVSDYELIAKLRQLPSVRYVEPHGVSQETLSQARSGETGGGSGNVNIGGSTNWTSCSNDCSTNCPTSADYFTITPNSKVGWNAGVNAHNVANLTTSMWDHCPAGAGITVALLDTGIDPANDQLDPQGQFAVGLSAGRTQERINMFNVEVEGDDTDDQCVHGTRMAAIIAHPRNDDGGITGMAYRVNLVVYRVGDLPAISYFNPLSVDAVIDAYEDIAQRQDIDLVSMSMGSNTKINPVNDAVSLAHANGKMIFCAAGSSGFEIHPAKSATTQTIAVTGVTRNSPSNTNLIKAQGCAKGSYVDFSMFTEEDLLTYTRTGLSTKMQDGDEVTWSSQSSHATALLAGIAASVWSVDPNFSREQVLGFLKSAASMGLNRDNEFGWGVIDGQSAVFGANLVANPPFSVSIAGPTSLSSYGQITWTSQVTSASTANLSYSWQWESETPTTGASCSRWFYPSGNSTFTFYTLSLTVSEQGGLNRTASTSIQIYPNFPF
ncbi:MAG: S8 family serine peptidase [Bacteroidota bacterium]